MTWFGVQQNAVVFAIGRENNNEFSTDCVAPCQTGNNRIRDRIIRYNRKYGICIIYELLLTMKIYIPSDSFQLSHLVLVHCSMY